MGDVFVTRSRRGEGLSRPVMAASLERAATLGPDVAMLFCGAHNVGLYAHFGFAEIAAPVIVGQPGGLEIAMPPHAMWRELRGAPPPADGPVRVRGLPF